MFNMLLNMQNENGHFMANIEDGAFRHLICIKVTEYPKHPSFSSSVMQKIVFAAC